LAWVDFGRRVLVPFMLVAFKSSLWVVAIKDLPLTLLSVKKGKNQ
jgi:hypothetical protein